MARAAILLALGSSSHPELVDAVGRHRFPVPVADDEVKRVKPDPEPYLHAEALLGVTAADCSVLADSGSGARGRHRGEVRHGSRAFEAQGRLAVDALVARLEEVSPSMLRRLFAERRAAGGSKVRIKTWSGRQMP